MSIASSGNGNAQKQRVINREVYTSNRALNSETWTNNEEVAVIEAAGGLSRGEVATLERLEVSLDLLEEQGATSSIEAFNVGTELSLSPAPVIADSAKWTDDGGTTLRTERFEDQDENDVLYFETMQSRSTYKDDTNGNAAGGYTDKLTFVIDFSELPEGPIEVDRHDRLYIHQLYRSLGSTDIQFNAVDDITFFWNVTDR